jgi:hypothetical protein
MKPTRSKFRDLPTESNGSRELSSVHIGGIGRFETLPIEKSAIPLALPFGGCFVLISDAKRYEAAKCDRVCKSNWSPVPLSCIIFSSSKNSWSKHIIRRKETRL